MRVSRLLMMLFLLQFCYVADAQNTLKGKVYEAGKDSVMAGVNIMNTRTGVSARSAADGRYTIMAAENDSLIFSYSGFKTRTLIVEFFMLQVNFDMDLEPQVVSLKEVKTSGGYQADSLERREYYKDIYKKQAGITGRNRPAEGVGVVLSPVSFFSKESKQKRVLRKRLEKEEKESYIDHSFPMPWIKNLTGLDGDSLSLFMYRYRPSYSFCRKTNRQQMFFYVNEKLKEFRKADPAD